MEEKRAAPRKGLRDPRPQVLDAGSKGLWVNRGQRGHGEERHDLWLPDAKDSIREGAGLGEDQGSRSGGRHCNPAQATMLPGTEVRHAPEMPSLFFVKS